MIKVKRLNEIKNITGYTNSDLIRQGIEYIIKKYEK